MFNKKNRGFTLAELLIVILIVAIFAVLGLPGLTKTKENAIGREAQANLKLIAAAEKIYRMEAGGYYPVPTGTITSVSDINSNLRLSLPSSSGVNWNYSVTDNTSDTFTATATRTTGAGAGTYAGCTWSITHSTDKPTTETCP